MFLHTYSFRLQSFVKIYISRGSVATRLWCSGTFNNQGIANLFTKSGSDFLIGHHLAEIWTMTKLGVFENTV